MQVCAQALASVSTPPSLLSLRALDGWLLGTGRCGAPFLVQRPAVWEELGTPGSGYTACPVT